MDYDYLMNRYRQPAADPFAQQRKRQPQVQPLSPQEEEGLLSQIGGKLMGGVGYVGQSLGKAFGGRAIRGALGGKPEELASIIPFSDALGITDERNQVTGEDLLKQWGVLDGPGEKGSFEARDLLGPALEIGLDPATYLTFGGAALTKAGKAAKLAGTLKGSTAERIAAGQGGLAGLRVPFTDASAILGTGPGAEAFAKAPLRTAVGALPGKLGTTGTNLVDKAWDSKAGQLAKGIGRGAAGLFDPSVTLGGKTYLGEESQAMARAANAKMPGAAVKAKEEFLGLAEPLTAAGGHKFGEELAEAIEGVAGPARPGVAKASEGVGVAMKRIKDEATDMGIDTSAWPDKDYLPQQKTFIEGEKGHLPGPAGNFHSRFEEGRIEAFRGLRKEQKNAIMQDPAIVGETRTLNQGTGQLLVEAQHIRKNHLGMTAADEAKYHELSNAKPPRMIADPASPNGVSPNPEWDRLNELSTKVKQSQDLAEIAAKLTPDYAKGRRYFGNNPLIDVHARTLAHEQQMVEVGAVYDALAKSSVSQALTNEPGAPTIREVLNKMGMKDYGTPGQAPRGAGAQILKRLHPGATLDDLDRLKVNPKLAEELTRSAKAFTTPEALEPVIKAFDSITNLTKAGQTVVAPGFHFRNLMTGLFQNWVKGFRDPRFGELDPRAYLTPFKEANTLRKGGAIKGAAEMPYFQGKNLTDAQATDELRKLMFTHDTLPMVGDSKSFGESKSVDILGRGAMGAAIPEVKLPQSITGPGIDELLNPLSKESTLRKAVGLSPVGGQSSTWKPWKTAGVGTQKETRFAPIAAGQEAGRAVDDLNRASAFIANMRQGATPEVASASAKAAHYDYSKITPFERSVMRRVIPFYNFSRHNLPFVLEQLVQQPGGKMASAIKFTGAQRAQSGFVPPYIGEGLSIPVGQEQDGRQRFIGRLGLPFEEAFDELSPGAKPIQRGGQKLLGGTNPIIKAPLEFLTGQQFHTGRELADLSSEGLTGNTFIDQLISNSPVSRIAGMGRTLADERKGAGTKAMNVLGPFKATDVDMDKARDIAVRGYIEEVLRENPAVRKFTKLSVKPEEMGQLGPEENELFRLLRTLEGQAQKKARK